MKKKYHCSKLKDNFIELVSIKEGISFLFMTQVKYDTIHLTDEDASKLSNNIKEALTNNLLNIGE